MELGTLDIAVFLGFMLTAVAFSMWKSRKEKTSEDYFLAGRGLMWPVIGFSIVAANLSTEQFVGMAGQGASDIGLAVSNWQLTGAVGIIIVAFFFLPRFLRAGIYTMPEYLEYRYNATARALMAVSTVIIYVGVTITTVIYTGALALHTIFGMELLLGIWLIGGLAGLYTIWGGLKAVAWADLLLGSALMAGGFITMFLGFQAVGGVDAFMTHNADRLHMILPANHPVLPWTGLLAGMWIPIFYYCGLNQFIVQRTLAARDLRHGQLGIIFAAAMWVLVPFFIVFPGIMAYQLYGDTMDASDQAYPMLIRNLVPVGVRGFIFAALAGAIISSLASMLNSASTIFTMDVYKRLFHKDAAQGTIILVGRCSTFTFVALGCLIAPILADERFGGIFNFIQKFQGYISPGILAAFVFGFVVKRAPGAAGVAALVGCPVIYGTLDFLWSEDIAYLNMMALTFGLVIALMSIITLVAPLREPKEMPVKQDFDTKPSPLVLGAGLTVIACIVVFYAVFW